MVKQINKMPKEKIKRRSGYTKHEEIRLLLSANYLVLWLLAVIGSLT